MGREPKAKHRRSGHIWKCRSRHSCTESDRRWQRDRAEGAAAGRRRGFGRCSLEWSRCIVVRQGCQGGPSLD
eukprot:685238-Amphidinium_carterae.1